MRMPSRWWETSLVCLNPSLVSPVDLLATLSEDLTRPPGLLPPLPCAAR